MKFTKMHGLGNDYVYINGFEEVVENLSELAIRVSDRHFGIGSDGLICINPSEIADFEMLMYNADGSQGEMCGNGIRCLGKYVYERGLTNHEYISVDTLAGIKYLELEVENGGVKLVKVEMGKPQLEVESIPVIVEEKYCISYPMVIEHEEYKMTCVSMGNPHAVIFVKNMKHLDIEIIGAKIEKYEKFPNRINVEFVNVIDEDTIEMRVWERGSGETLACGTGACAAVVASIVNGYTNNKVNVHLLGGELDIEWNQVSNMVYMTGPAKMVFDGEIDLY